MMLQYGPRLRTVFEKGGSVRNPSRVDRFLESKFEIETAILHEFFPVLFDLDL